MLHMIIDDDIGTLTALQLSLLEAKFHPDPYRPEIAASPFVARLACQVVEALAKKRNTINSRGFKSWRAIENHPTKIEVIKMHLNRCDDIIWDEWCDVEKELMVSLLIDPFVAEKSTIEDLIKFKNSKTNCRSQ